jgi:hypothetical protein
MSDNLNGGAAADLQLGSSPAAPAAELPAPSVLPTSKSPNLSADQVQAIAADLIAHGVPREQVEAALKADGQEAVNLDALDTRTEDQKDFDAFFGPTPPASEYRIDYIGRIPAGIETPALAEYHAQATAWLSKVGFPENIGPAVIERSLDVGQKFNQASESERQLWIRDQNAQFERMAGGPEKAKEKMSLAAKALARAPGGFTEALRVCGALHDAGIVMHLANQGERLGARGG